MAAEYSILAVGPDFGVCHWFRVGGVWMGADDGG